MKSKDINFTAIDFETSLGARWSICQLGLVRVENGNIAQKICKLIQPPNNQYSDINTKIHGIKPSDTKDSPFFNDIWDEIKPYFAGNLVVAHNVDFDIDCLYKTLDYYNIPIPKFKVDCTFKRTGARLEILCDAYDINLEHQHNAECDALACAQIYMNLVDKIEPDYSKTKRKIRKSIFSQPGHERIKGDLLKPDLSHGDPDSPFYGKKVVFTGALATIKRQVAAEIIKKKGADIDTVISRKTDFVIKGKDPGPVKLKKIYKYNQDGSYIKIIGENEFLKMIKQK
jgi:DNA polymerase-3 subunit epsilon